MWVVSGGRGRPRTCCSRITSKPITPGDGALVGLLAGLVGALVHLRPVDSDRHPGVAHTSRTLVQRLIGIAGTMPPEMRDTIERGMSQREHGGIGLLLARTRVVLHPDALHRQRLLDDRRPDRRHAVQAVRASEYVRRLDAELTRCAAGGGRLVPPARRYRGRLGVARRPATIAEPWPTTSPASRSTICCAKTARFRRRRSFAPQARDRGRRHLRRGRSRSRSVLGAIRRRAGMVAAVGQRPRLAAAAREMVRRRTAQRLRQLPRSSRARRRGATRRR